MYGKQLAPSFVSPFKSIMQSIQVSCSTNPRLLMGREKNGVGKIPRLPPEASSGLPIFSRDAVITIVLFDFPFLLPRKQMWTQFFTSPFAFFWRFANNVFNKWHKHLNAIFHRTEESDTCSPYSCPDIMHIPQWEVYIPWQILLPIPVRALVLFDQICALIILIQSSFLQLTAL